MFDYVIVGAGLAGCVLAERLASQRGAKLLLIEKRSHIGGNCHDRYDEHGVLVHQYGPHLFHTSNAEVFHYLSGFTDWIEYQHRVLAVVDGRKVPLPFNLNSLHRVFPRTMAISLESKLIGHYGFDVKVPILELRKQEDTELKYLADFIYHKVFLNYTVKQWACSPEEIAPEVTARVPIFISRDDRYFQDKYQVIPRHGYTHLFENLIDHPGIKLMLNTDYREIVRLDTDTGRIQCFGQPFAGHLIHTGMIDELFDHRFGELPYRSLKFQFEHMAMDRYQEVTTVNYPEDYDFTRITEFKHITGQRIPGTTIVREFPQDYDRLDAQRNIPYYPVFQEDNLKRYQRYADFARKFSHVTLVGRLAEYRYFDMDDIVARALEVYRTRFGNGT